MNPITRDAWDAYCARVSELNGGVNVEKQFTVAPSVQQALETRVQESSAFLGMINIVPVPELSGEKIGLGMNRSIASRTDTSGAGRRTPTDPTGLDQVGYSLKQTNFDTALKYAKLDLWAKFKDFQPRIAAAISERCALDRIMIGFNGLSAAATTDRDAYPLLQDVNIGWLRDMRLNNDARVLGSDTNDGTGVTTAQPITVGLGGTFANLDALVMDAVHSALPSWARNRTDLVAICSADLLHDKYFMKANKDEKPTEELALEVIMASKRLGGKQALVAPYFPDGTIFLTPLKNLSIYYQDGKRRRHIREEPDADQVADYQSSNEGYVIEDYEQAVLVENVSLIEPDAG